MFHSEEPWRAVVDANAKVFGHKVGNSHFQLSRMSSYIEIHPGAFLTKADLKIGVYGERLCFGIDGQACYWAWTWHCTPIHAHGLFCVNLTRP
ncbi:hypothetical protein [Haloactinospora alba]|uniref:hypothetical protein n=1 Tax=Haloactinospora alba TaxID=405555 RepID=UPI0011532D10|nr:hypothetical protein [Haloactinospora alba]